jgi:hypothetical protein
MINNNSHLYQHAAKQAGVYVEKFGWHGVCRLLEMQVAPIPHAPASSGRGNKTPAMQISTCIQHGFAINTPNGYAITEKGLAMLEKLKKAKLTDLAIKISNTEKGGAA